MAALYKQTCYLISPYWWTFCSFFTITDNSVSLTYYIMCHLHTTNSMHGFYISVSVSIEQKPGSRIVAGWSGLYCNYFRYCWDHPPFGIPTAMWVPVPIPSTSMESQLAPPDPFPRFLPFGWVRSISQCSVILFYFWQALHILWPSLLDCWSFLYCFLGVL